MVGDETIKYGGALGNSKPEYDSRNGCTYYTTTKNGKKTKLYTGFCFTECFPINTCDGKAKLAELNGLSLADQETMMYQYGCESGLDQSLSFPADTKYKE